MIQRKQTVFLLIVTIINIVALLLPVATIMIGGRKVSDVYNIASIDHLGNSHYDTIPLFILLLASTIKSVYTILIYKKRQKQARLCRANIFILVLWYSVLIGISKLLVEGAPYIHYEWSICLPAVSMVFLYLARRAILADEKLVRSADRIR